LRSSNSVYPDEKGKTVKELIEAVGLIDAEAEAFDGRYLRPHGAPRGRRPPTRGRLHHTGYVVASIAEAAPLFQRLLGVGWDGNVIHDPMQMVRVTFLPQNLPDEATVELVEPAHKRSPVNQFLAAGGGLHHVCYEVPSLAAQLADSQAAGNTLVRIPMKAAAFGGRRIAWVRTPTGLLVEYLEVSHPVVVSAHLQPVEASL
jgi:methylmalonyl-CoA/ethylmalonyl-CoA epimerase